MSIVISTVLNILVFILILSFLVLIHELGHYLAARWKKIRVEEFGLGYPPRAKALFAKWGTIFSLNWIPFGGFVRMEGEDELVAPTSSKKAKTDQDGPFYEKSEIARLIVILAGAAVNVAFGVLAFAIVFSFWGIPGGVQITGIVPELPAAEAGIEPGMVVTGIEVADQTYQVSGSNDLVPVVLAHYGQPAQLLVQAECGRQLCSEVTAYPLQIRTQAEAEDNQGGLGITFQEYSQFYPWYEMPFRGMWFGLVQAIMLGVLILQTLGTMLVDLVTRAVVPQEVMGPVGIVHETARQDLISQGPLHVLLFAGLISINLGVMNVLPIPALDGGRACFIMLEKIVGKKRIQKVEGYANYGGFAFLLMLIFLITARDIFRIVTGG